jgi:hypothetical protein
VGVDGDHPVPPPILARKRRDIVKRCDQPARQSVDILALGQVGLHRQRSGLMTEGKEPERRAKQRGGRSGHEQQQVEELIDTHGLVKRFPIETPAQSLPCPLMNNPGCDNMKTTHKQLLSNSRNYLYCSCFASFIQP